MAKKCKMVMQSGLEDFEKIKDLHRQIPNDVAFDIWDAYKKVTGVELAPLIEGNEAEWPELKQFLSLLRGVVGKYNIALDNAPATEVAPCFYALASLWGSGQIYEEDLVIANQLFNIPVYKCHSGTFDHDRRHLIEFECH